MSQTVVIDGEITLKSKIDGEISLRSMIDGDLGVILGADGLEYESGTFTPTANVSGYSKLYRLPHEDAPFCVIVADKSGNANVAHNALALLIVDFNTLFGITMPSNDPELTYTAVMAQAYRNTSATYPKSYTTLYREGRGLITNEGFSVLSEADDTYFIKDHTYEWLAVWR